jgi:hypothetical protein
MLWKSLFEVHRDRRSIVNNQLSPCHSIWAHCISNFFNMQPVLYGLGAGSLSKMCGKPIAEDESKNSHLKRVEFLL